MSRAVYRTKQIELCCCLRDVSSTKSESTEACKRTFKEQWLCWLPLCASQLPKMALKGV